MNRATSATGWVRNPTLKSPKLDPRQASSYELGWTYNPITGCLNHTDGLCKGGGFPCYAYILAHGRLKSRYLANRNIANPPFPQGGEYGVGTLQAAFCDPFYPRFWEKRKEELLPRFAGKRVKKRRGIFVCDMSDLFGIGIPEEWTTRIMMACEMWQEHRFYLLTKQPQNLPKFSPFSDNCWVGITLTKPDPYALLALDEVEAKVRYVSVEPMLARFPSFDFSNMPVDWLIIGAQTKPYKPPKIEWVQEIVEAADEAGIPVFLKDNLMPLVNSVEMPKYERLWAHKNKSVLKFPLWVRQEIPVCQ